MTQLTTVSLPQITEYIRIATESSASNVTAALLDYKHQCFPDVDSMAEFALDW